MPRPWWHYGNPTSHILQCGIAEQDAASLAAGAAAGGLLPMLFSMEGFYWRMLDQIRESVAFQALPVVLVGTSGGIGDLLGPMVQSDALLSALAAMHGIEVFEASDANTAKLLVAEIMANGRPAYLRLPHEAIAPITDLETLGRRNLAEGWWDIESDVDPSVVIFVAGAMRDLVRLVADRLRNDKQLRVRVIEVFGHTRFANLDARRREALVPPGALAVSVHNAPSAVLGQQLPQSRIAIGVDDWGMSGWPLATLYERVGLTAEAVYERIVELQK